MSDVEKKPSPDHHLYAGFMGQFTKRADMPAPPEPFVKPLAANGLASKPGLYTVGQLVRYAQQHAERRVREERAEDERLLREAMEAIESVIQGCYTEIVHATIAALRKRLGE